MVVVGVIVAIMVSLFFWMFIYALTQDNGSNSTEIYFYEDPDMDEGKLLDFSDEDEDECVDQEPPI